MKEEDKEPLEEKNLCFKNSTSNCVCKSHSSHETDVIDRVPVIFASLVAMIEFLELSHWRRE